MEKGRRAASLFVILHHVWKRIPRYVRAFLVIFAVLYAAVTVDLLFRLPILGIVLVVALVWIGWSVFALIALLGNLKSGKYR